MKFPASTWILFICLLFSMGFTILLIKQSTTPNKVIQVSLRHDSVAVVTGNRMIEIFSKKNSRVSYELNGYLKNQNIQRVFLVISDSLVCPIRVMPNGFFSITLKISLDQIKNYKFKLQATRNIYIDSGEIELSVVADVYGKDDVSVALIAAIGLLSGLLQIVQFGFYIKEKNSQKASA